MCVCLLYSVTVINAHSANKPLRDRHSRQVSIHSKQMTVGEDRSSCDKGCALRIMGVAVCNVGIIMFHAQLKIFDLNGDGKLGLSEMAR